LKQSRGVNHPRDMDEWRKQENRGGLKPYPSAPAGMPNPAGGIPQFGGSAAILLLAPLVHIARVIDAATLLQEGVLVVARRIAVRMDRDPYEHQHQPRARRTIVHHEALAPPFCARQYIE
jgi:hypothetical protein